MYGLAFRIRKEKLRHIAEQTPAAFTRLGDVLQSDNNGLAELPGTLMGYTSGHYERNTNRHEYATTFLNDFLSFVPLQLPQLLDVTTMEEPQFYGDYVLLTFPLRDTYELEEVMDMFEDDMELITLYHHIPMPTEQYGHSTCAYSNPAFGQMFKMNAKTDADGRVSCVSPLFTIRSI